MKPSRFPDAQKAFILKQGADGIPVAEICRRTGISQATYFNWKTKYDGLLPTETKRPKQLKDPNGKLRNRLLIDARTKIRTASERSLYIPLEHHSVRWILANRKMMRENKNLERPI